LVQDPKRSDAVLEKILAAEPDFNNLPALTSLLEKETVLFIKEIEEFFSGT